MPPKRKNNSQKAGTPAKGKAGKKNATKATMGLRKNPKRKVSNDFVAETSAKKGKEKDDPVSSGEDSNVLSLTPHQSDDDLDSDVHGQGSSENRSNSAVIAADTPDKQVGQVASTPMDIGKQVGEALRPYLKHLEKSWRGKKRSRKRRRRRSSSSSQSETTDGSESSSSDESSDSSDGGRHRKRKRHRREKRKKRKQSSKGEQLQSPSQSTVYTRGCKSPVGQLAIRPRNVDSDGSEDLARKQSMSDEDTDEFVKSLNSSLSVPPLVGGREDGRDSGDQGRDGDKGRGRQELKDQRHQDEADRVIQELEANKADLAKPSGRWTRHLHSLVVDFEHFHLISHVDRKLRKQIQEGDFTIDFKRLVPRSRSRCKPDNRVQMIQRDGGTYFVPAENESKEILSYKTWELAYKVFMGIFLEKWPERSKELLQYSHVIQVASNTPPWENVSPLETLGYDFTPNMVY